MSPSGDDRDEIAWSGAVFAAVSVVLLVTISLYGARYGVVAASDPSDGPSLADMGRHVEANWGPLSVLWSTELIAYVLMAVSSFTIVAASSGGSRFFPTKAAWVSVGVGASLQAGLYPFMLGGYAAAAPIASELPALLDGFNRAALVLFYASNAAILLGVGAVFAANIARPEVVPGRPALLGALICFAGFLLLLMVPAGVLSLPAVIPFALLAHLFKIYLGVRLWRFGRGATAA